MKTIILASVLIFYRVQAELNYSIPLTKVFPPGIINDFGTCFANHPDVPRCLNCETIIKCENGQEVNRVVCKEKYPTKPHCDPITRSCQALNTCVESPIVPMTCKYKGMFPHPLSCNKYAVCEGKGISKEYSCPISDKNVPLKFDNTKKLCSSTLTKCNTFSPENGLCKDKPLSVVTYPNDPKIFVVCPSRSKPIELQTCEMPTEIVGTDNKCVFKCPAEGFFAHRVQWQFYICINEGSGVLKPYLMQCVAGAVFDEVERHCVTVPPKPVPDP